MGWYVESPNGRHGPFTDQELLVEISNGRIRAADLLLPPDVAEGIPAKFFPFFGMLTPHYGDWFTCFARNPTGLGRRGWSLLFAIVPMGFLFAIAGVTIFPPGIYPRLLLAAPGLALAAIVLYPFGFVMFHLSSQFRFVVALAVGIGSTVIALLLLSLFWSNY